MRLGQRLLSRAGELEVGQFAAGGDGWRLVVANVVRPEDTVVVTAHDEMAMQPTGTAARPRGGEGAVAEDHHVRRGGRGRRGPEHLPVDVQRLDRPVGEQVWLTIGRWEPALMSGAA